MKNILSFNEFVNESKLNEAKRESSHDFSESTYSIKGEGGPDGAHPDASKYFLEFFKVKNEKDILGIQSEDMGEIDNKIDAELEKIEAIKDFKSDKKLDDIIDSTGAAGEVAFSKSTGVLKIADYGIESYFWKK
jgi:hypothetical protein